MIVGRAGAGEARCASVAILSALLLVTPGAANPSDPVEIEGEVEAATYDDDGNVIRVAIYDPDWGPVLVLSSGAGDELLTHVGAIVSAEGEIRELDDDGGYSYAIDVSSYTIVDPAEPEQGSAAASLHGAGE